MTKPVTGVAILMLQDEGKLNVADPVAKYLPEFASLKTPSGKSANLTIAQILTHTSGLGEADTKGVRLAKTLADRQDRPHLIVANHVPAYPSFRAPDAAKPGQKATGHEQRQFWSPLFEKFNVDVVLEHHDHTFPGKWCSEIFLPDQPERTRG